MKAIATCYPAREIRTMDEVIDRIFGSQGLSGGSRYQAGAGLAVDVLDTPENLIVRAAVPGVKPENLNVFVEKNVLTIQGTSEAFSASESDRVFRREIATGSFERSLRLPDNVNPDAIDAQFEHGVLTVKIPHLPEEQPKTVKVNVVSAEGNAS